MRRVRIGLLGCGTVGGGLVRLLETERQRIRGRFALDLRVERVLVRDATRPRPGVAPSRVTTRALDVVDADCDVVVELIGGVHTAATLVRRAIQRGRHVVTANKALLAASGPELSRAAAAAGVELGVEASVCGGVPVLRILRQGLAGDTIDSLSGILNGTCNYVLTRMEAGLTLAQALREAQERGFAEADPSLDLSGEDALQKLKVLSRFAFDEPVRRAVCRGIAVLESEDVVRLRRSGYVYRQIAAARRVAGGVELDVGLRKLAADEPLARITGEQNAVAIQARAAGELLVAGKGAGSLPTATAVLADILSVSGAERTRDAA